MSRELDLDPEIVDDLRLRAASEHDRSRTRISSTTLGTWAPRERIVGAWKCRTPPCRTMIDVSEDTMERWAQFNVMLRSRGEEPLDTSTIMRCDRCQAEVNRRRPELLRKRHDEMAECIRQLKDSPDPRREHELIKQLTLWHHGDVPGLLDAIERRTSAAKGRKKGDV